MRRLGPRRAKRAKIATKVKRAKRSAAVVLGLTLSILNGAFVFSCSALGVSGEDYRSEGGQLSRAKIENLRI